PGLAPDVRGPLQHRTGNRNWPGRSQPTERAAHSIQAGRVRSGELHPSLTRPAWVPEVSGDQMVAGARCSSIRSSATGRADDYSVPPFFTSTLNAALVADPVSGVAESSIVAGPMGASLSASTITLTSLSLALMCGSPGVTFNPWGGLIFKCTSCL